MISITRENKHLVSIRLTLGRHRLIIDVGIPPHPALWVWYNSRVRDPDECNCRAMLQIPEQSLEEVDRFVGIFDPNIFSRAFYE